MTIREYAVRKMSEAGKKNHTYYCPLCGEPVRSDDEYEYIQTRRKEDCFYHERCLELYFRPHSGRKRK